MNGQIAIYRPLTQKIKEREVEILLELFEKKEDL